MECRHHDPEVTSGGYVRRVTHDEIADAVGAYLTSNLHAKFSSEF